MTIYLNKCVTSLIVLTTQEKVLFSFNLVGVDGVTDQITLGDFVQSIEMSAPSIKVHKVELIGGDGTIHKQFIVPGHHMFHWIECGWLSSEKGSRVYVTLSEMI
jgi:hypothetical protein